MNEDFLQFIWKQKLFSQSKQFSTKGNKIDVIDVGRQNFDAGPDFFDARIKLDDILWAGNVEIHLKSSSWYQHGHDSDPAYENVILHVVLEDDASVVLRNEREIPCLLLKFTPKLLSNYQMLMSSEKWIPCFDEVRNIQNFFVRNWLDRMLLERLERKAQEVKEILMHNNNSWEDTLYQVLARYFGMRVNSDPFQQLARSIPLRFLAKQKNSLFQLEAILFGQSGLLEKYDCNDIYFHKLKKEYQFLAQKFQLKPIPYSRWKWLRLRPPNFPTVRIAQFASLIHNSQALFSKICEADNIVDISNLLKCEASHYWNNHYLFGVQSSQKIKKLGKDGVDALLINCIVPVLFLYGKYTDSQKRIDKACDFLTQIKGERNAIIKKWKQCGVEGKTAYQTQALLQLKANYCDHSNCLDCEFGNRIIRNVENEI